MRTIVLIGAICLPLLGQDFFSASFDRDPNVPGYAVDTENPIRHGPCLFAAAANSLSGFSPGAGNQARTLDPLTVTMQFSGPFGGTFTGTGTNIPSGTFVLNPDGSSTLSTPNGNIVGFAADAEILLNPDGTARVTFGKVAFQSPEIFNGVFRILILLYPDACTMAGHTDDPVNTATGEVLAKPTADLKLGGPLPLAFRRYYGSMLGINGVTSALGRNWMHNFDTRLSTSGTRVAIVLWGGKVVRFTQSGSAYQVVGSESYSDQLQLANGEYRYISSFDNLTYAYNTSGQLIRIQDRNGRQLTVTPGANGPTLVSDGFGRTLTFTYTGSSLTKVTDQTGRSISFTQTGGNLTSFVDAAGKTTAYSYTTGGSLAGLLVATTKPKGNTGYTQTYDTSGRATKQTDGLGNAIATLAYASGSTTITDGLGNKTIHTYATPGILSQLTDANGKTQSFTYDAATRRTGSTDRNGNRRSTTYDATSGYPASIADALGNTTSYAYTATTVNNVT